MSEINNSLAILCGGKSSRMGGFFKGNLKIEEKTFLEMVYEVTSPLFDETYLIGNPDINIIPFTNSENIIRIDDLYKNCGPLAGIYTALKFSKSESVFICSCDMPFIKKEKIEFLLKTHEEYGNMITIPWIDQRFNPLFGVYSSKLVKTAKDLILKRKLRVSNLFKLEKTMMVYSDDATVFKNINSTEEYEEIKKSPFLKGDKNSFPQNYKRLTSLYHKFREIQSPSET